MLLVEALATRWGIENGPFPRKTVWAEIALTGSGNHDPVSRDAMKYDAVDRDAAAHDVKGF